MRILIAGGAGFVGSSLCLNFRKSLPGAAIVAFDNLRRRGSERNLAIFKEHNIQFVHGDVRSADDIQGCGAGFDLFVDASAEPSVLAGQEGSPAYVLDTNLKGTLNCLEYARKSCGQFLFLSTSRVYSIDPLRAISLDENKTRFVVGAAEQGGLSQEGVAETFPTHLPRSLYGATKLASEMFVQEYVNTYGMKAIINRCGVIAGPGQFGKVDQGVFTLWVARHFLGEPLKYTGFGGTGKQVRDLLHPADLFALVKAQLDKPSQWNGSVFNIGGGNFCSTSLLELTKICEEVTGNTVKFSSSPETNPVDIPFYISDCRQARAAFDWQPKSDVRKIVTDIYVWLKSIGPEARQLFG